MSTTQPAGEGHPDREELRAELEATRSAYHALLAQISAADWRRPDGDSRRTIGEDLVHITGYLESVLPLGVAAARQGKAHVLPPLPPALVHGISYLGSKFQSRGQTGQTVAARYDTAHAAALALLAGIGDAEWPLATTLVSDHFTVAELFHHHTVHFAEHAAAIRLTLRRRVPRA